MSFTGKLVLLLVLVAVVPAALSGGLSAYTSQQEVVARIEHFHRRNASLMASSIDTFVVDAAGGLRLATRLVPFDQFPAHQRNDALRIPYRQFGFVNAVALLDASGHQLCPPVFGSDPQAGQSTPGRQPLTEQDLDTFAKHIPLQAALSAGTAFGPSYVSGRTGTARVAVAVSFEVHAGSERWVLAAEVSLRQISELVDKAAPADSGTAFLVDAEARPVIHPDNTLPGHGGPMKNLPFLAPARARSARVSSGEAPAALVAVASVPTLGWSLVTSQPESQAFVTVHRLRRYALFWTALSLGLAVFGGVFFARGVSRPLRDLSAAAGAIASGDLARRIAVHTRDEIGHLTGAFNDMAASLQESFATVSRQKEEIEAFNRELQQRVDERTRELHEAQEQILRSQKLAAIGELGAGVAHEINNPLTGIQGFAQLLLAEADPGSRLQEHLETIAHETERIRTVVGDLLRFSQNPDGTQRVPVNLNLAIRNALRMAASQIEGHGIRIEQELDDDLPRVIGEPYAFQQVFLHLITNAINAMPEGGTLRLATAPVEGGAVRAAVADTGRGIPAARLSRIFDPFYTTKEEWSGKGLGLSVTHRMVEDHHGTIRVRSEENKGSEFVIVLPGLADERHLT